MPRNNLTIEKQIAEATAAITNVRSNAELQIALAAYGYTTDRIKQGEQLTDSAKAHYQKKNAAYGGLFSAVDTLSSAERQAQALYMRHVKLARVALEGDRGTLQTLHLLGKRKTDLAGWIAQAQQFYTAALSNGNIQDQLDSVNLTRSMLEQGAQQIDTVAISLAARRQQLGNAQHATSVRNAALTELDSWMRDLKIIARVALKDRPQLLEQIGVRV